MWDDEINEAARELTDRSPDSDFKARVFARIEAEAGRIGPGTEGGRSRAGDWAPGIRSWLAVAAALLVAVVIYRGTYLEVERTQSASTSAVRLEPERPIVADAARLEPDTTRVRPAPLRRPPETTIADSPSTTAEPPLEDSESIVFESLFIDPIEIASLQSADDPISPLSVPSIDVPVLDVPALSQ
jgi:hypothetical protein